MDSMSRALIAAATIGAAAWWLVRRRKGHHLSSSTTTTSTTTTTVSTDAVPSLPLTMRGISISGYAPLDDAISMKQDWPVPRPGAGELLLRVHAVALAPGDARMQSGDARLMQKPKAFPYIPGGDCCGVVVAVGPKQSAEHDSFAVGDRVYATFVDPNPLGCLAEYCVVKQALAANKPEGLSFLEASTLGSSAVTAQTVVETHVRPGDRVLVLGGTGGVGCFVVQLAKAAGASFVAATSSQPGLLLELGADRAVDYTAEQWWDLPEFMGGDNRFDVIVDLVGGKEAWKQAKSCKVREELVCLACVAPFFCIPLHPFGLYSLTR